ncbi:SepM family pheromone-processing serine protease [Aquibacillus kalidii]|uniref:SepM family pheromone-processing serine protease n=1 Tax=Aquibacillus kalidii TaxID=2762597 RepID=UPI001645AA78|nr:SepM family pheromone-processing serine protease [Aquibacillus kalidii]
MKIDRRRLIITGVIFVFVAFLSLYRLPFYIYQPGGADALNPVVSVNSGYKSEGDMHLVTVSGSQATPISYLLGKIRSHYDVLPIEEVFPEGMDKDAYFEAQLQMMESSQQASTVVAYTAADKQIDIDYKGVYVVSVIEGMPAEGILKSGDKITKVNDKDIEQTDDLIDYVSSQDAGETISITVDREGEILTKEIQLEAFPNMENKVGVGIQLVTEREVEVEPKVEFASGNIGGPSAGLMFSLEIYDQLTKEDITKGYQIAGTGEISYAGEVGRIGGIDKKVIAADEEGCDIFFAPNEGGRDGSNYQIARETAEEIGTDMKVIPVDTFQDALNYLQQLEAKS